MAKRKTSGESKDDMQPVGSPFNGEMIEASATQNTNIKSTLVYEKNNPLFYLHGEYLVDSNSAASENRVLYCRPQFHEQFEFLKKTVCDNSGFAYILGPAGAGKTITTLAFASTLDRNKWIVTWINLSKSGPHVCVRFEGKTKKIIEIPLKEFDVRKVLHWSQKDKKHILFIDDFCLIENSHKEILTYITCWIDENKDDRSVAMICSSSWRDHLKDKVRIVYNVKEFSVNSWELEEYLQAVKNDEFYESVKENLGTDVGREKDSSTKVTMNTRKALVESKFYYAGGNCDYVFACNQNSVVSLLGQAMQSLSDVSSILNSDYSRQSPDAINRLFIFPLNGSDCEYTIPVSIVSQWAIAQLFKFTGPEFVRQLADKLRPHSSQSLNGWIYNLWFISNLRTKGVIIYDEKGTVADVWKRSRIVEFSDIPEFPDCGIWLRPAKKNHGGFDAVFVDKSKAYIRFVIIAQAKEHQVKIECFQKFLNAVLNRLSFGLKKLNIWFIVHRFYRSHFNLSILPSAESLEKFGIKKGKELDHIRTDTIDGW